MSRAHLKSERGAVAVEFALVVPVLFLLIFGVVEFGNIYNVQIQLTSAAREGAREMALGGDAAAARAAAISAAPTLSPAMTPSQVAVTPAACAPSQNTTVSITYPVSSITGLFPTGVTLRGSAVMRCGG